MCSTQATRGLRGLVACIVCCGFSGAVLALPGTEETAPRAPAGLLEFEKDILPIIRENCLRCHGEKKRKRGLDLRTPAGILRGGESGEVIIAGTPGESRLLERLSTGEMPPGSDTNRLCVPVEAVAERDFTKYRLGLPCIPLCDRPPVTLHTCIPLVLGVPARMAQTGPRTGLTFSMGT